MIIVSATEKVLIEQQADDIARLAKLIEIRFIHNILKIKVNKQGRTNIPNVVVKHIGNCILFTLLVLEKNNLINLKGVKYEQTKVY